MGRRRPHHHAVAHPGEGPQRGERLGVGDEIDVVGRPVRGLHEWLEPSPDSGHIGGEAVLGEHPYVMATLDKTLGEPELGRHIATPVPQHE